MMRLGRRLACALLLLSSGIATAAEMPSSKPTAPELSAPRKDPKTARLAELNALTRLLVPEREVGGRELEQVLELLEVLVVREAGRPPSPILVGSAATVERGMGAMRGERPVRALVAAAVELAVLGGPRAPELEESFFTAFLAQRGVKPEEADARPELARELAEIGQWAVATVEREGAKLPESERAVARVRVELARGRYGEAAALARKAAAGATAKDARWQAWIAAAMLLDGKSREAAPFVAAAEAAGGEALRILELARRQAQHAAAVDGAARALKAAGFGAAAAAGARPRALTDACRTLVGAPAVAGSAGAGAAGAAGSSAKRPASLSATGVRTLPPVPATGAAGEAVLACELLLWESGSHDWLEAAAARTPTTAAAAGARAAATLARLFTGAGGKRPNESERKRLLGAYLEQVGKLKLDGIDRRLVVLLGHLGASETPRDWTPATQAERAELAALATEAPCDARAFALRAAAVRRDRPKLGELVSSVVKQCAGAPDGLQTTVDALAIGLAIAYESPPAIADAAGLEAAATQLARANPTAAQAIAAHADAVALKALAAPVESVFALEAALSLYEDALRKSSTLLAPPARQRLESNAAFLSLALARHAAATNEKRQAMRERAALHLKVALGLGATAQVQAVRLMYDLDVKAGAPPAPSELKRLPPGRTRRRLACLAAEAAQARSLRDATATFRAIASEAPAPDERKLTVDELLPDTIADFNVQLLEHTLRPHIQLTTQLSLAPPCAPDKRPAPTKLPPPAATPADGGQ
jgi:hypothetical protein